MKIRYKLLLLIVFVLPSVFKCQTNVIGQWRTQFAYSQGIAVAQGNGKMYCATQGGLFSYNLSDNSFSLMTKISGLSDFGISTINFDPLTNTLIVAYLDANIDMIQNGAVINLPDIKISNITGSKAINSVFFSSGFAYLSCGFGIVVVDLTLHQTADTYFIGPLGTAINVRDVNTDGNSLYAATDDGIFIAPLKSQNLADYNSWTLQTAGGIPNGTNQIFNTMAFFNSKMYANNSLYLMNPSTNYKKDQVWEYNPSTLTWSKAPTICCDDFKKLRVNNNNLVAVGDNYLNVFNTSEVLSLYNYFHYGFGNAIMADGLIDNQNVGWIADQVYGLVKVTINGVGEILTPNGPSTNNVFSMTYSAGNIWLAPGGVSSEWAQPAWISDGVSIFSNNSWSTIKGVQPGGSMDSLKNVVCITVDPANPKHAFASSQHSGVLEFNNNALVKIYGPYNSTLQSQQYVPNFWEVLAAGIAYDTLGNLWVGNGYTNNLLSTRKANGTWQALNFGFLANTQIAGQLMVTSLNQKWLDLPRNNSILVYNDNAPNAPFSVPNSTNSKLIKPGVGLGNLPGSTVVCMAEDKNAAIWLGTDNGIVVIYNPANIFNGGGSWDAQPVYVQQNGYTQLLFQAQQVNAIAVDGANRKWCGTQTAGVFLMSADGTKQIYNFTTSNSPLMSNQVTSITINSITGEVFFGTPIGVISYRGTATEGGSEFGQVYTFPNPVKHDYTGPIAIANLVDNADVKITDITGTLIFKTIALGGQAIWDGNNFSGERAHTGVYLVFCSSPDGTQKAVTKILFIN